MSTLHQNRHTQVLLLTGAAFCLSTWLTGKGLFDKAIEAGVASTEGIITAAMTAAVSGVLIGGATMLLFGVAVHASRKQTWPVVGLAISLLPFTLGISTYSALLANAGLPSIIYDMRDKATAYAVWVEASTKDAEKAQSARDTMTPMRDEICNKAADERRTGNLSGSRGIGAVYTAYSGSCDNLQKIVKTLDDTIQRTHERREAGSALLSELGEITQNTKLNVFERQAAFREKTLGLRKLVTQSSAENLSERLSTQLKNMTALVAGLDIQSGQFGQRQSSAIQNLKNTLGMVSKNVENMLQSRDESLSEPPGELLDMGVAVAVYWQRNIPQILIAVLLDLMNLWFFALLLVGRSTEQSSPVNQKPGKRAPKTKRNKEVLT